MECRWARSLVSTVCVTQVDPTCTSTASGAGGCRDMESRVERCSTFLATTEARSSPWRYVRRSTRAPCTGGPSPLATMVMVSSAHITMGWCTKGTAHVHGIRRAHAPDERGGHCSSHVHTVYNPFTFDHAPEDVGDWSS